MSDFDQKDIIQGCRKGNKFFQELLYRKYAGTFLKICLRYAGNQLDAEQMLNDSFLKILNNIRRVRNMNAVEGWMRKIVVNTCLDGLKSKDFRGFFQTDDLSETNPEIPVEAEGVAQLEYQELLRLIQKLPPMTKAVFNLNVFEGFSHKEISVRLGISVSTSSWHVSHARKILQQRILHLRNLEKSGYATP